MREGGCLAECRCLGVVRKGAPWAWRDTNIVWLENYNRKFLSGEEAHMQHSPSQIL